MATSRKWFREVCGIAASEGVDTPRVVIGKRHPKLIGTIKGRPFSITFSATPSDWRVPTKLRSDFRRAVKQA